MSWIITFLVIAFGGGLWLWVLRYYDRIEPESVRHLLQVGVIGGFIAVAVAAVLNELARWQLGLGYDLHLEVPAQLLPLVAFCLFVGLIEETIKAIATVFTTRRMGNLDEPVDAMIYAMTVGLGFAVFENLIYARQFGNDVLIARFLWPVPAHMAYSAIWGYGLAKAKYVYAGRSMGRVMAPWIVLAGLLHAGANFLLFLQVPLAAWGSLFIFAILVIQAHRGIQRLVAESPFLEPGECPTCRYVNAPSAVLCARCGDSLTDTEIFGTCPCGLKRIPQALTDCPVCGVPIDKAAAASDQIAQRNESP